MIVLSFTIAASLNIHIGLLTAAGGYVSSEWSEGPRRSILLTQMFEEFLTRPIATFAVKASYLELRVAYPYYYAGPTIFDRPPDAHYVVVSEIQPLPWAWLPYYRPLTLPVSRRQSGGAQIHLRVYEHV